MVFNAKWNKNGNSLAITENTGKTIIHRFSDKFSDYNQ